jgi:hypothetical protein
MKASLKNMLLTAIKLNKETLFSESFIIDEA